MRRKGREILGRSQVMPEIENRSESFLAIFFAVLQKKSPAIFLAGLNLTFMKKATLQSVC